MCKVVFTESTFDIIDYDSSCTNIDRSRQWILHIQKQMKYGTNLIQIFNPKIKTAWEHKWQ